MASHLKYPKKRGFLAWDELGCLARALGAEIFRNHLPEDLTIKDGGISLTNLYHVIDLFKYLNAPLDRTFNIHTDEWNLHVVKRAAALLDTRVFSFSELQSIRMAYQVYESRDTKGLVLDEWTLLRALKMCGRTISPLKMMHRIKHMRESFEEPERIQLHEFFDLLLWCETYEGADLTAQEMDLAKDGRNLFKWEEFEAVLSHHDERLAARLDQLYLQQEWQFTREKHSSKKMPKDIPPVDAEIRKKQVRHHREKYRHLHGQLTTAQRRVFQAKAGYVRPRPLSATNVDTLEGRDDWSESSWSGGDAGGRQTLYELTRQLYAAPRSANMAAEEHEEVPRPEVCRYIRPQTTPAVTDSDVINMRHAVESLNFEMETIEHKYEQILHDDQDDLLPGYRQKVANRPLQAPTTQQLPARRKTALNLDQSSTRLSSSRRPTPSETHDRLCDARNRGWYVTKAKRGPHIVVTGPSYDSSPVGKLLTKLYERSQDQAGGGRDYVYRYTRRGDVNPAASQVWHSRLVGSGGLPPPAPRDPSEGGTSKAEQNAPISLAHDSLESRARKTARESLVPRVTSSDQSGDVTRANDDKRFDETSDGTQERKKKPHTEKRTQLPEDKSQALKETSTDDTRNKEKIIAFRKVGRIEVLEEIVEKGEEEEGRHKVKRADTKQETLKSGVSTSVSRPGVGGQVDLGSVEYSSSSCRSQSPHRVAPLVKDVASLALRGPDWLSNIILSKDHPRPPTRDERACRRLAERLGTNASSELQSLLSY